MASSDVPLLVFGPRSLEYDFGPSHPLTPRRFGPGIDLLRAVGAEPGLAPEPATDEQLLALHRSEYVSTVRRLSADPRGSGAMGIGLSDNPAFSGMHEAAATVAGGSLAAMDAILGGSTLHAYHPGGGLHHAMASKAWGFCIYNDVALAVARARSAGLRVLYVDLDVHHGDGVQALTFDDPGVLTISFHESGRYLFPETGFPDELGSGAAAGAKVNLPLEPYTGEAAWLAAVRALVPSPAAVFGPDLVVSQHGADSHAWDPLAHLRVTTTAMGEAARLVDAVAHRRAGGRWLATGGGGYDAYRVVPRAWALTWLAGAHREPPDATPVAWRERWSAEASLHGFPGMPGSFLDAPNAGLEAGAAQRVGEERSLATLARVRAAVLPRLVREAEDRGWWAPSTGAAAVSPARAGGPAATGPSGVLAPGATVPPAGSGGLDAAGSPGVQAPGATAAVPAPLAEPTASPEVLALGTAELDRLELESRVVAPFDPGEALALLRAAARDGARVVGAVAGGVVVGVAVAAASTGGAAAASESLLAIGVAPGFRGRGLGRALLRALIEGRPAGVALDAQLGVAERDVVDPIDVGERMAIARRLLAGAGFELRAPSPDLADEDPYAVLGHLRPT